MRVFLTVAVLLIGFGIETSTAQPDADLTAMIRADLESSFRQQTGLGFRSFRCDFGAASSLPSEFECEAVDDEGDQFLYRVWAGNDRLEGGVTVWQPVGQLYPEGVAWLRGPIEAFLGALEGNDPEGLKELLSPELSRSLTDQLTLDDLKNLLDATGSNREAMPMLYRSISAEVHAVEYRIAGEQAEIIGRFRIQGSMEETPQITAFLLLPPPGSELHARQLADTMSRNLSPYLGEAVADVRMPLHSLLRSGDVVEGEIQLENGSTIVVRAEQSGTTTDFDRNDYRFQVLEASWLVSSHLATTGDSDAKVTCPARTVPDGGSLVCTAERTDGSAERFELRRRGGEHRLMPAKG